MMNWNNRNLRILNITSYSFNGAIASAILQNFYTKTITLFGSYRKQDKLLENIQERKGKVDAIIFTNFAPTENRDAFLKIGKPILILDHHEGSEWYKGKNPDWHYSPDYSGAKMVQIFFSRYLPGLSCFKDLAEMADDFELWKLQNPKSIHYNRLFTKTDAFEFIRRWKKSRGSLALTESERNIISESLRDWKLYYESLSQLELPKNGRFITANDYLAEISKQFTDEKVDYYLLFNPSWKSITFRSSNPAISCKDIMATIGEFNASSTVGIMKCEDADKAKRICKNIVKAIENL